MRATMVCALFLPHSVLTTATSGVCAGTVLAMIRWIWHQSRFLGVLVLCGVLLRALAGIALFWISFLRLPVLESFQLGGGFWVLALDARTYYLAAQQAAQQGLATISPAGASPEYVRLLSLSLRLLGESPVTAVFVNVIFYATASAICVSMWRPCAQRAVRLTRATAIAALSFSPALLLVSTQALKDQLLALLIVVVVACVHVWLQSITTQQSGVTPRLLSLILLASAVYLIAGMRAYFAMLVVLDLATVLLVFTAWLPIQRRLGHFGTSLGVAAILWFAFMVGAGPYYGPYGRFLKDSFRIPFASSGSSAAADPFESAREGFVNAGGGTNIVGFGSRAGTGKRLASAGAKMADEALGLLVMFVPITVLRALSIISFAGGRGLLAITDADTLFLDVTIVLQSWLILSAGRFGRQNVPFLAFAVGLALALMLPMAYVVTNYGTLFRLRLMYAVPLWLSGVGLAKGACAVPLGGTDVAGVAIRR